MKDIPERTRARNRLPNRRAAETFTVEVGNLRYVVSVGRFAAGGLAEIFISNGKAGSDSDTAARDSAVVASVALQYGVPLEVIRRDGSACGPLGAALDRVAAEDER